jgi:hypothetical protein
MFGKLRTKHLLLLLVALAAIWWFSGLFSPRAQQRTFRENILKLDTNAVTGFTITPALYKEFPPIRFQRAGEGWRMFWATDSGAVDDHPVHELLRSWSSMRVVQMAGRMAEVRDRYDLGDSTADRLTIVAGNEKHELLVGRQTAGEPPMTVVNIPGDENAYAIEGSLGSYTDFAFSEWLPKYLVTGDPKNWKRLTFNFPADTGYVMERSGGRWLIEGVMTDSSRTQKFLSSLARARGRSVTDPADTLAAVPQFRLVVEDTTRSAPMVVVIYAANGKFIVRSSLNPQTVMPFDGREEVPRMFRPRTAFMSR